MYVIVSSTLAQHQNCVSTTFLFPSALDNSVTIIDLTRIAKDFSRGKKAESKIFFSFQIIIESSLDFIVLFRYISLCVQ